MRRLETRILMADHAKGLYKDDLNGHDRGSHLEREGKDVMSTKLTDRISASYTSVRLSSSADGSSQEPMAGLIFMCNDKVRKQCFRYGVFGMPMARKQLVDQVRPGLKLFLFEFEARELWGIYEATTTMGVDIEPDAYRGAEVPFPAQVRFRVYKKCEQLPEDIFRQAIRKNYYMPSKFKFELTEYQVLKLMRLFNPRETSSNGVGDRGLFPVKAAPNFKKYNENLQAFKEVDFFPDLKNESWEKRIAATPADSRFTKQLDHENLENISDHIIKKREQYFIGNGQSDLQSQLIASHIRAAGSLHPDVSIKHYISNSEGANIDHNSVEVARDDSYMVDPWYNKKYLLSRGESANDPKRKGSIYSPKDGPVRHADLFDTRLVSKDSENLDEDEYRLYKLKMKCLNDRAFQRQLLSLDQYGRDENFVQTGLQGDTKRKGEYVETGQGFDTRRFQGPDSVQTAVRRDVYIDEDHYLYEQKNLPQNGRMYRADFVIPQGSSQVLVDKLDSYDASPEKISRKNQFVTEGLEPCLVQKLAYVPVTPDVSRPPAVLRASIEGNCDGRIHSSTGPHKFSSRFSQDSHTTSNLAGYSSNSRNLTPGIKNGRAWLGNLCHDGDNLMQTHDGQDDFFEGSEHASPNKIENEVQLARASGKRSKFVRVDNSNSYNKSSLLENTPHQSSDGYVKHKPSVWSRLSRPKHVPLTDSLLVQRDFNESPDSRGYFGKKQKFPKSFISEVETDVETSFTDLEDAGRASEEDFVIDFKRRKSTRETGHSVNLNGPETMLYSEMAGKCKNPSIDDCGDIKGRRRIKRPILAGDDSLGRRLQINARIENTVHKISQATTLPPEFAKEISNVPTEMEKETL